MTAYDLRISAWRSDVCSSDLPRRVARSIVTNFALCIELAGALRKIIAGRFACPTVDAGSFTRRLGCSAVRGSDMDRRIVALQRVHHLSLIATRCAGELADGGRARFTRQRIDEGDAPAGFVDREAEHGRCVALTFIAEIGR